MRDKRTTPIKKDLKLEDDIYIKVKVNVTTGNQISKKNYKFINKSFTTLFTDLSDKAVVEGKIVLFELPEDIHNFIPDKEMFNSVKIKKQASPQRIWVNEEVPSSIGFGYICKYNESDPIVDYLDTFLENKIVPKLEEEIKNKSIKY